MIPKKEQAVDLKKLQEDLIQFATSLQEIHKGFSTSLSELSEESLKYIDEKELAKRYEDLSEASLLAQEIGNLKITKKAIWLPWRSKPAYPPHFPDRKKTQSRPMRQRVPVFSLGKLWKWVLDTPSSPEKDRLLLKFHSQKDYLMSMGKRNPTLEEIITRDILSEIKTYINIIKERKKKYFEKNPVHELVFDPKIQAQQIIRTVHRDYISLLENKYLKELREHRLKVEKALDASEGNPRLNRGLRLLLLKINKMQQILMLLIHKYSMNLLRV